MKSIAPILETAIVFMTNKSDPSIMDRFREIHSQVSEISTCYVLLDASTPDIEKTWLSYCREHKLENIPFILFKISDIARELSVRLFSPGRIVPGSAHLPLLWLSLKLKHKFYWFIEDDVVFTGCWDRLITDISADKSDLLCSHLASHRDIPNWTWWSTFKAPSAALKASDPLALVTKGFFPIYRISARALLKILDCQRAGWTGHFEVLVPTILKYAGYSVADLNRVSTSPVYSAGIIRYGEGSDGLSSLRFRPPVSVAELRSSTSPTIFHPIKSNTSEISESIEPNMKSRPYLKGLSIEIVKGRDIQLLGSAPSFGGILELKEHEVFVSVNGAALALKKPLVPSITFINTSVSGTRGAGLETYRMLSKINTEHLIIAEGSPAFSERWLGILELVTFNSFDFYSLEMRQEFMKKWLGPLNGIQGDDVPSTGFFALMALLAQGAKSVVLNGFSLIDGHSYLEREHARHHVGMDKRVIEFIRKEGLPVRGSIITPSGELLLG